MQKDLQGKRFWVYTLTIAVIAAFWLVIAAYSIRTSLPYNPAKLPFESHSNKVLLKSFLPEGFSFFTRDPREPRLFIYNIESDSLKLINLPNGSPQNMFGIFKTARAQNLEAGYLLSVIKEESWMKCDEGQGLQCSKNDKVPYIQIRNLYDSPLLCGKIMLVVRKPVPWAWSKNVAEELMPYDYLKLEIICDSTQL